MVREKYLFLRQEPGVEEDEENPAVRLSMEATALHSQILREYDDPGQ